MNNQARQGSVGTSRHAISGFFVFCLIGLFAVLATMLTLVGIRGYRSTYEASVRNSEGQIALSYLLNKVHANDQVGGVAIENMEGTDVLCLREGIDGMDYETRIFGADGSLCEYFCEATDPFDASLGEPLCDISSLAMRFEQPWLLAVTLAQQGREPFTAHMALRAREASTP